MAGRHLYTYSAQCVRVIDADTVVLDVDLGFGVWLRGQSFRVLGINARERRTPGGEAAATYVRQLMPPGSTCTISSVKCDKYGGRYDAMISLADGTDLGRHLMETGWAVSWDGTGLKVVPPWPRSAS